MCRFHLMGRVRAISDEFTFNRYSDFQLMSIVWAKHKAFVLVRRLCRAPCQERCLSGPHPMIAIRSVKDRETEMPDSKLLSASLTER
jgi:hypothetical protein